MMHEFGGFWRRFAKRFFDHIEIDRETVERVKALPHEGTVVYVMRTRSTLDYLLFNYLFRKYNLPLSKFANGIDLTFFRGVFIWLKALWARNLGEISPEAPVLEQLRETVHQKESALLFMKVRALAAERRASPRFIDTLVTLQRTMSNPIFLVPQHLAWPRKPASKKQGWLDIAFGHRDASGKMRKIVHFLLSSHTASVQMGEPINLKSVLADHDGWSDERIARKVRRVLMIHLAREAMAISGPKVKPSSMIQREILERKRFREDLISLARAEGLSPYDAQEKAAKHLKEIAASMQFEVLSGFCRALNFLFHKIFRGIEVNPEGMKRVKEAARLSRTAPLVLIPSHKSHIDYLVISWLFFNHQFVPPHIAAGANLSFFPVGTLFRHSGAFFLRRSFNGMPIYKLVFKNYLWKLIREGYPVEFFIEGGRSRTGKLLPPKLGMLSMLLEGIQKGEFKDLQFVPINVSYERVLETGSYRHELTGGSKTEESVTEVVRAGKVLRSRYGRVYANIGEPIRFSEYLGMAPADAMKDMSTRRYRQFTRQLAYHLLRRIQESTVVSPTALIGTALLSHHRRGISATRLRELVGFMVELLERRNASMSASIRHVLKKHASAIEEADRLNRREGARARGDALRGLLDEGLLLLKRLVDCVQRGNELVYTVADKHRIELDYYRNPILSIMSADCLVSSALRAFDEPVPIDILAAEVRRLSYWFRLEFIYNSSQSFDENFQETLNRLEMEGLITVSDEDVVTPSAPLAIDFLRGMMLHLVEGYWVSADSIRSLFTKPMEQSDWIEYARAHADNEFLQGDVRRAESASTAVIKNALSLFVEEGLIQRNQTGGGRRRESYLALGQEHSREDVAFRRDELGMFLMGRQSVGRQASLSELPLPAMPASTNEAPDRGAITKNHEADGAYPPSPSTENDSIESE
ncbi:MAG: 1-acyl-sn-glycerol-3-phosphate acyltransferase [Myxococcota bacterium]|nr:1-acyl-sn-glycerol-3-phosphate acyltransferase [Myxococcota bacterium]